MQPWNGFKFEETPAPNNEIFLSDLKTEKSENILN